MSKKIEKCKICEKNITTRSKGKKFRHCGTDQSIKDSLIEDLSREKPKKETPEKKEEKQEETKKPEKKQSESIEVKKGEDESNDGKKQEETKNDREGNGWEI